MTSDIEHKVWKVLQQKDQVLKRHATVNKTAFILHIIFVKVSEEMVALLAMIGFYIFGICCYKVCTGFHESSSTETKKIVQRSRFGSNVERKISVRKTQRTDVKVKYLSV